MPLIILPIRRHYRFALCSAMAFFFVCASAATVNAQVTNILAGRWASARVQTEEVRFLLQMQRITAAEAQARNAAINNELVAIRTAMNALPPQTRGDITQQAETLFQTRIVPLREQWRQQLVEKQQSDQQRVQQLSKEMDADAQASGKLQAERTLTAERAQRGEISQAQATAADRQAEQQILALRKKYDDLDTERRNQGLGLYWANQFTRSEAVYAARAVADGRVRIRLDDTQSEVGKDAHRTADLTLSIQRNQVFVTARAMTPAEANALNSTAQALLNSLQQKYASSPAYGDWRDRAVRLVQEGAAAQRPQWEKDAVAAREAAQTATTRQAPATTQQGPATSPDSGYGYSSLRSGGAGQSQPAQGGAQAPPIATTPNQGTPRPRTSGPIAPRRQVTDPTAVVATTTYLPRPASPLGGSIPWTTVGLVLLLVGGGGAGVYVLKTRRASAPAAFKPAPQFQVPAQPVVAAAPVVTQQAPAASVSTSPSRAGGLKEMVLEQQRDKYQTRYNDALDEVTNASMVLTQMAPLLAAVHGNLLVLSDSLYERLQALMIARYGSLAKTLMNALILRPAWRLFRRVGLLLKIVIGVVIWWVFGTFLRALFVAGSLPLAVLIYAAVVVVGFFLERRLVLQAPLALLKKNAGEFKALRLSYVYKDQRPEVIQGQPALRAMRVLAASKTPQTTDEVFAEAVGVGTFMLGVGSLATYRLDSSGSALQMSAAQNEFMNRHGALVTEVMSNLGGFADSTLPPLAEYGQAHWRKQRAANQLPQLEALVRDVDRIEKLWQDTYVSDEVFEVLFRSIDMFNMRDAATPPGLLFYGTTGNGKKHLARKIADTLSARFEQVNPSKIASAEQIEALWTSSRGTDPVVLFVPNAETLFPRSQDGASAPNTLEWIAEWEKHEPRESRVWVLMTARNDESVDQAILDHVGQDSKIEIKPPDAAGRALVLALAGQQYQVSSTPSEAVLKATGGSSIQDLRRIVMAAKRAAAPSQPQESHWLQAVKTVRGAGGKFSDPTKTWDRLILPAKVKEQLQVACKILQDAEEYKKKRVEIPKILLYGPPGTGKTEIARTIANEAGVNFMEGSLADLKGGYVGQSVQKVKELFDKARASAPTVLFLDEIDAATKKRGSEGADAFTEEIVNVMLTQLEGAAKSDRPVFVLAATNRRETIDQAILDRFRRQIEIPPPDEAGRRDILKGMLEEVRDSWAPDFVLDEVATALAKRSNGHAGRGLKKLVENAMSQAEAVALSTVPPTEVQLTKEILLSELAQLTASGSDKVDESARWDTLVVSDQTLEQLKQLSNAMRHMETFQRQGIDPPRGAVLYGPPGTGKTQIAKTLANESEIRFLFKTGADLGHTAQQVRTVFDDARAVAPCILFIDEFEKAAQSREKGGSAEIVTELLAQMQGAKKNDRPVFVLAATNYLDQMDDAILSRFTYRIEIPNPDVGQREKLFAIVLKKYPRADFDVAALAGELARKGGGLAGRDINDVVVRAAQAAAQRALAAGTQENVMLTGDDLLKEVAEMVKSRSDAVDPTARWETLVLSDATIKTLKQIGTAVRNLEDRLKQGIEPPRGAVLFGPPGTGKTQIARTLANESGVQFVSATAKDVTGQYVGESTQKVAKLFADARKKAPCILFIDEFENAAASRTGSRGSGFADEVVTQLLAEMDGVKSTGRPVFVLAATNHLERVDAAVLSRFTYQVEVPNPTPEQRERLFEIALKKYRVDFDVKEMAAELAKRSGNVGGRQIGDVVKKAVQDAAQRAEEAGTSNDIVLTRADLLAQFAPKGRPVAEEDLTKVWSEIVLKPQVKESLLSMIRLFNAGSKAAPKGLLLYGPPGTGKTEIARMLAKSTGCEFLATDLTKLKGSYVGESGKNVKDLWDKARAHGKAVIFVDECDGLFARRGGTNTDAAIEEITNAFLPTWDGLDSSGQVWVLGATNKRERIDEAIDSRFGEKIEIGLPDAPERFQILQLEMRKLESAIQVPEFVGKATSGFSGRNLSKVAAAVFRLASSHGGQATDDTWRQVIGQFATSTSDAVDPNARWDTLILPDGVIKRLKRMSEMLKHAETLREQGLEPPKAALLFGPPGTGKTQIARTLANESGLNFIAASPSDIKGAHLGESGRLVKELFERARSKPTVLFIDEIESGAAARGGGKADQYTGEIVNELLTQMDGVKKATGTVFVLAATNLPDQVDAAVLSRFSDRLEIPNPGLDERTRMIKTFLGKRRIDFDVNQVAGEVAAMTNGMSGRDLSALVQRASQQSAERAIDAGMASNIVLGRDDLVSQVTASNT